MKKKLSLEPVLIYLHPAQKTRLARRARQKQGSISHEVRRAIALYLQIPCGHFDRMVELGQAANYSADRSLRRLDAAIHFVSGFLPPVAKPLREPED